MTGTRDATSFARPGRSLSGRVDRALAIHNRLITAGGTGLGHRTIQVVRRDATGRHRLRDVTTDGAGRFTISDVPRFGPISTYSVRYPGEAGYLPSIAAKYTANVARLRPDLRISLRHKAIWYDQKADVRIHLGHTYSSKSVTLYDVPIQGGFHRVLKATVNRHGDLVAHVRTPVNTTYYAYFKGDPRYAERKVSIVELSAPRTSIQLGGGYATSGKYRLYHSNTDMKLIGKMLPAHVGDCLRFNAAHRSGGKWVEDAASGCISTSRHGVAVAYFHPPHPRLGVAYVLQSFYDGDAVHDGSHSAGRLAKFTAASASSARSASARTSGKGSWTIGR